MAFQLFQRLAAHPLKVSVRKIFRKTKEFAPHFKRHFLNRHCEFESYMPLGPHSFAGLPRERFERLRCDARPEPIASWARSASARAWSRIALSSAILSFSIGSERSAMPFPP
jgi:hypothetical protein